MTVYRKFLQKAYDGAAIDLDGADVRACFVSSAYTPDTTDTGHEFHDDLAGILLTENLIGVTWANRVLDADDFTISDPGGATVATHVVFVLWLGSSATSPLISVEDITDLTFDGTDDDGTFNASGIFRLGGA